MLVLIRERGPVSCFLCELQEFACVQSGQSNRQTKQLQFICFIADAQGSMATSLTF